MAACMQPSLQYLPQLLALADESSPHPSHPHPHLSALPLKLPMSTSTTSPTAAGMQAASM